MTAVNAATNLNLNQATLESIVQRVWGEGRTMSQGLMIGDATNAGILTMPDVLNAIAAMSQEGNDTHPSS